MACAQSGADALLVLSILWQNSGRFRSVSWGSVNLATVKGWKIARESFGWCFDNNIDSSTQSTARFYMANNIISWRDSSEHDIAAGCWHNGGLIVPGHARLAEYYAIRYRNDFLEALDDIAGRDTANESH